MMIRMAKNLPEEPERTRISSRPGAPIKTDTEAIRRAQEAAMIADLQSAALKPKPKREEQVTLLCRVDKELGLRIKRLRVDHGISEQALIADALSVYFGDRDNETIVASLKAKGAGL